MTDKEPAPPGAIRLLRSPAQLLAFGFGSGLSPVAPGTVGTVAAVPLYLLLVQLPLPAYLLMVLVAAVGGVWICERASRELGVHDHPGIVWDEFVGFWIAAVALPAQPLWIASAFVVFRVYDILKPWPISWLDQEVQGGLGIMIDDIAAGLLACATLQLALFAVHSW
jgi:phosphatidylglycerophosphatase A